MKRIVCLLLSVIMTVSCISCAETKKEADDKDENSVTVKKDPPGTFFLYESSEGGGSAIASEDTFLNAAEYGISTFQVSHSFPELKDSQKIFGAEKTVLRYKNSNVRLKNKSSKEFGSFYSIIDQYLSENKEVEVNYLHGTDIVCQYYRRLGIKRNEKNDSLTDAHMQKIADDFLRTIYPKELLDNLTCGAVHRDDMLDCVTVSYDRYIEGYSTDESILLFISYAGIPFGLSANNIGKYNYTATVTKEELDTAKELLFEKVASLKLQEISHSKDSVALTTDTSGKVYLETWFTFTVGEEGEKMMESLYVNVN